MKLEWRNLWTTKDWKPMVATTLNEANKELADMMPYTEDGTQIKDVDSGHVWNWNPPDDAGPRFDP